jgi:hypothetical protein
MKNPVPWTLTLAACALALASCRSDTGVTGADGDDVVPAANAPEADDYQLDSSGGTLIRLEGGSIVSTGVGVEIAGATATITRGGTYTVRGELANGQIRVQASSTDKVKLVLDGASIATADDAPIFVKNASKLVIYLAPNSVNTLTDGAASTRDGAIHCKTRLSIFGPGKLNVTGNVDDGINAEGGIVIEEGVFAVQSLESGIKSDINVTVNGGSFTINAGNDGLHADTALVINGGEIAVARSYEGIEGASITMTGGTVHIASSDDGVNTSPADGSTTTPGGPGGAPPGMGGETGSSPFYMRGGYLYVDANGDGLDINGPVEMSDGVVIVNGPTANDNGALDYTGSFTVTGGSLLAAGSSGMAQMPSAGSTRNSLMLKFAAAQPAGTFVRVQNAAGGDVVTFRPTKRYQNLVLNSPLLAKGTGYSVYVGGGSTGTERDGVFTGGTYYGGTQKASFNVTGTQTTVSVN